MAFILSVFSEKASGLGTKFFDDDNPPCDISNCSADVVPVVGQTRFVQNSEVNVRAYFDSPDGNITIYGSNFCPGLGYDRIQSGDSWQGLVNGAPVTRFVATWDNDTRSDVIIGDRWGDGGNYGPCSTDKTFAITGMTRDDTGKYYVNIKASHINKWDGEDGIQNTFTIAQTGGAAYRIAQRGGDYQNPSGYDATVQQTTVPGSCDPGQNIDCNFLDYYIKFGTECKQMVNRPVNIGLYDLDNRYDLTGAQLFRDIKVALYENGTIVRGFGAGDGDGDNDIWTPAGGDNRALLKGFTSKPNAKYELVIRDVYQNNTIQYSTPFNGIYYAITCPPPEEPPPIQSCATDPPGLPCTNLETYTCDLVKGWAWDRDRVKNGSDRFRSTYIQVILDGVLVANPYLYTSGELRTDVNAAYGISGIHGFRFNPTTQWGIDRTQNHSLVVNVLNYGANGLPGAYSTFANVTIPACEFRPTGTIYADCSKIWGYATDPNYPQVRVVVSVDGGGSTTQYADVSNGGYWSIPTNSLQGPDFVKHIARATIYGRNSSGGEDGVNSVPSPYEYGPCPPSVNCVQGSSASLPEAGYPFTVNAQFNFSPSVTPSGRPSRPNYVMTGSISPGLYVNNDIAYTSDDSAAYSGDVTVTPTNPGIYTVTWTFSGINLATVSCNSTVEVYDKPYLKVYGGDAAGGAGFAQSLPSCTPVNGGIRAFNKGPGGGYAGSGAQVAAIALGAIDGFTSANRRTALPVSPTGLTLANQPAVGYGGNYGGGGYCIPDYWQGAPSPLPAVNLPIAEVADKRVVYANGDVVINSDITYANANSGSWSVDTIPSFWLIVRGGNIYIGPGVKQLDGVYVSLPDPASGAGGKIYTCSSGGAAAPSDPQIASNAPNNCGNAQLRVNGAFIASQVKLLRTYSSLRFSTAQETPGATNAAEIFTFSPEIWLSMPDLGITSSSPDYDSITSLAPIL